MNDAHAAASAATIEAAGGVVLRTGSQGHEVLVVHRPRYDDWSLPKGKLDPGEDAPTAAVREVEEETGVVATIGQELPSVTYRVSAGPKRVRWFQMSPVTGDPTRRPPDAEVSRACWVPVDDALRLLTYGLERRVLLGCLSQGAPPSPDPGDACR